MKSIRISFLCKKVLMVALCLMLVGVLYCNTASAVTYQTGVGVSFTFNPKLTLTLSSSNLVISNLAPGTSDNSNEIAITVSTNAAYGYNLSATVGNSTTYNNTDLTHSSGASSGKFTSIAFQANPANYISSISSNNTWGYSIDSGTKYNGLPLYSDTTNIATLKATDSTPATGTDTVNFLIGAKASTTQPTGDYKNVINFIAVTNPVPQFLYDEVASMSKGTLAANNVLLADTITTPTSTDRTEDTSNSGVYEYDPAVYGVASDAANNHKIYFYRGILETNPGSYGSAGSANAYPNYVKLENNTCWRIIRTTGSGGVKMIYNGTWNNSSCGNSSSNAQVTTQPFASKGTSTQSSTNWTNNLAFVGYTFNNSVTDSTTATALGTILGNDSDVSVNNTRSSMKVYIEDTWYANNMTAYTNMLESNAGYCVDRSAYDSSGNPQNESVTVLPYSTTQSLYFGAYYRIGSSYYTRTPSLTCPRSTVDLYRYVANSTGTGNELKYPTALITADEATLAGNGFSGVAASNSKSFLTSGSLQWLLSPNRTGGGTRLNEGGSLSDNNIAGSRGVRPVISLIPGTEIVDGSGTATDPWTIK